MVTNEDLLSGLAAGETLKLDFEMSYAGSKEPTVVGASLDGTDFCSGEAGVTTATVTSTTTEGSPSSGELTEGRIISKDLSSGQCNSLTTITNSWDGNVQGKLKIVVPTDISSFTIELETDISLTNINFYTAIASPSSGKQFSLTNYDWFSGLAAGQILELDYQMTFSGGVQPNIVRLTLNGADACSGGGPSTSPSPATTSPNPGTTPGTTTSNPATTTSDSAPSTTSSSNTESTTSSSTSCSAERYDYGEVLRLSNLFYEAQRSGDLPDDNRIPWRGDSSTDDKGNNGEDLSGGYHDGDNKRVHKPYQT